MRPANPSGSPRESQSSEEVAGAELDGCPDCALASRSEQSAGRETCTDSVPCVCGDPSKIAVEELGDFLGFGSQRPERQLGQGPDNLWALKDGHYWVIEAKSGATSDFVAKKDVGLLSQSMLWFGEKYTPDQSATPVMVHHSRKLYKDATPPPGMKIINRQVLGELIASVKSLAAGLAAGGWAEPAAIAKLLEGHKLTPADLSARLKPTTGGTAWADTIRPRRAQASRQRSQHDGYLW